LSTVFGQEFGSATNAPCTVVMNSYLKQGRSEKKTRSYKA